MAQRLEQMGPLWEGQAQLPFVVDEVTSKKPLRGQSCFNMDPAEKNYCSTTLIVTGTDLDPDAVTKMLGLVPTQTWRQGERKQFERSDGTVRQFDSIHEYGGWKCPLWHDLQDATLFDQIHHAVRELASCATGLGELRTRGFNVELNCLDNSSGCSHLLVPHYLLKKLVELSVDLDISIYR